jgi:hypothetical protein
VIEIDDLEIEFLVENRYTLMQQLGDGDFDVV